MNRPFGQLDLVVLSVWWVSGQGLNRLSFYSSIARSFGKGATMNIRVKVVRPAPIKCKNIHAFASALVWVYPFNTWFP